VRPYVILAAATLTLATPAPTLVLFDGRTAAGWTQSGPGSFTVEGGALVTHGGMGLLWYDRRRFRDFELQLDWKVDARCANSGVFVRFPGRPRSPEDAIRSGYEVQIDDCDPNGPAYRTGGIYGRAPARRLVSKPPGEWNRYRIRVVGQHYTVWLNGARVTNFDGARGRVGYVGLQNHDDGSRVSFRRIRVIPLGSR
jgi:3-keto-disaccharide hydrolase